ncbi:unnamed protein product, partial [Owenia fusiformis]
MKSMAEVLEKTKKQLNKSSINCNICAQGDELIIAVARCIECADYLCDTCNKSHGRMKLSNSHKCVKLTGDIEKDYKMAIDNLAQRNIDCTEHNNQPLKFYCKTDKTVVCTDCWNFNHNGHNCVKIEDVAEEEIQNAFASIGQRKDFLENQAKMSYDLTDTQQQKLEKILSSIQSDCRAMIKELEKYFNKLQSKAKKAHKTIIEQIQSQRSDIELERGDTERTLHYMTSLQKYGHPVEIVNSSADIKQKLQDWSSKLLSADFEHHEKSLDMGSYQPGHLDISKLRQFLTSHDETSVKTSATSLQSKRSQLGPLSVPKARRVLPSTDKEEDISTDTIPF